MQQPVTTPGTGPIPPGTPYPPMRPVPVGAPEASSGRSQGISVAVFSGILAVLLVVVIGLGLTRNSSESRNLVEVVLDGFAVLQDFALRVLGVVFG